MEEKATITRDNKGFGKDLIVEEVAPVPETTQELAPQESESIEAQQEVQVEQTPEPPKETHSQKNFKALKAEAARLAKERDDAQALIRQYELEKQRRQVQTQPEPQDEDFSLDNDAIAEGKHIKTLSKQLKSIKQDLEESRRESRALSIKNSLVSKYPDYDQVVNKENLTALELLKPHLARAIDLSDPYNAGLACYELIKEFNIDAKEADKTEITRALIKENLSKPKPGVAVKGQKNEQTPMGRASEFYEGPLTEEMKKIFYQEMLRDMGKT